MAKTTHAIEYELCGELESPTRRTGRGPGLTQAAFDSLNPGLPRPHTAGETAGFTVIARLGCVDPAESTIIEDVHGSRVSPPPGTRVPHAGHHREGTPRKAAIASISGCVHACRARCSRMVATMNAARSRGLSP